MNLSKAFWYSSLIALFISMVLITFTPQPAESKLEVIAAMKLKKALKLKALAKGWVAAGKIAKLKKKKLLKKMPLLNKKGGWLAKVGKGWAMVAGKGWMKLAAGMTGAEHAYGWMNSPAGKESVFVKLAHLILANLKAPIQKVLPTKVIHVPPPPPPVHVIHHPPVDIYHHHPPHTFVEPVVEVFQHHHGSLFW